MGELPDLHSVNRFLRWPVLHNTDHHMGEITARLVAFIGDGKTPVALPLFQGRMTCRPDVVSRINNPFTTDSTRGLTRSANRLPSCQEVASARTCWTRPASTTQP